MGIDSPACGQVMLAQEWTGPQGHRAGLRLSWLAWQHDGSYVTGHKPGQRNRHGENTMTSLEVYAAHSLLGIKMIKTQVWQQKLTSIAH